MKIAPYLLHNFKGLGGDFYDSSQGHGESVPGALAAASSGTLESEEKEPDDLSNQFTVDTDLTFHIERRDSSSQSSDAFNNDGLARWSRVCVQPVIRNKFIHTPALLTIKVCQGFPSHS